MIIEGCDYAFTHEDPAQLYAAGKRFAMRYVGPGTDDKHLHADERDQIWAAGMAIVLLAEGAESSALGGLPTGVAHANSALVAARFLGAPDSLPIYFAVDFDVAAWQWPAVANYFRGAGSVLGKSRVGIYGGIRAMQWAARDGVAAWFFQTYAWSAGQWYPGNHVEQYDNGVQLAGGEVDLCRAVQDNYGQWGPAGAHTTPAVRGNEMGYFFSEANGSQYFADPSFERYWAFTGDGSWDAVHAAAGKPPVPVIDGKMIAAGAFGEYQGIYTLPRKAPSGGHGGQVDLSDAAVKDVADATADELHNRLAQ